MFVIIGVIFNIVLAVSCITSEKESKSWQILLATSISDWEIVTGKALGIFYKCLPIWLLLLGHIVLFIIIGYINPIAFIQILIIISGVIVFLTGLGIYISSFCKKTTWAIIISFVLVLIAWLFLPITIQILSEIFGFRQFARSFLGTYYSTNPFLEIQVVMDTAGGIQNADLSLSALKYNWQNISNFNNLRSVFATTKFLIYIMLIYSSLGMFFAWLAKRRIRVNII